METMLYYLFVMFFPEVKGEVCCPVLAMPAVHLKGVTSIHSVSWCSQYLSGDEVNDLTFYLLFTLFCVVHWPKVSLLVFIVFWASPFDVYFLSFVVPYLYLIVTRNGVFVFICCVHFIIPFTFSPYQINLCICSCT